MLVLIEQTILIRGREFSKGKMIVLMAWWYEEEREGG